MIQFDVTNGFTTEKGITGAVTLSYLYKDCKLASDFKEKIMKHLQSAYEYEYNFFEAIVQNLMKTQDFFIECQKKMLAAKKIEEQEKIKFEIRYCDLYVKLMRAIQCKNNTQKQIEKLDQEGLI